MIRRRQFLAAATSLGLLPLLSRHADASETPHATRPNVVVIVLDDVGFSDLGAYGSEIRTPSIDRLAADGIRFNRFDTKAICSPTRASLLTGCNPQTVQMSDLPSAWANQQSTRKDKGELPQNVQTLAQVLRRAGYATMAIGKWHLAPGNDNGKPGRDRSWPTRRGFDSFYGFIDGWTDQYHPSLVNGTTKLPAPTSPGYHLSVDLVDRSIQNIDEVLKAAPDKPFFTYLALGAGHAPLQVPRQYIDRYAGVYEKGWDALRVERFNRLKAIKGMLPPGTKLPKPNGGDRGWASLDDDEKAVFARFMATYAGFIEHADEQIGRLIDHLKAAKQYENTVFVLLSDNGPASEGEQTGSFERMYAPNRMTAKQMRERIDELGTDKVQPEYQRPWAMLGSTPFRRYKLWPQAGGVRTPLIITWPGKVAAPGSVRQQYIDVIDLAPTIAELAGTRFPEKVDDVEQIPVAGQSMKSVLADKDAPGRQVQFFDMRNNRAITAGRWKALAVHQPKTPFETDRWRLFDLANDFTETNDVAALYPEKLEELKQLWLKEATKYSNPVLAELKPPLYVNYFEDDLQERD